MHGRNVKKSEQQMQFDEADVDRTQKRERKPIAITNAP